MAFFEQASGIVEELWSTLPTDQQLTRGQGATPRRGKLQRKREPVEATAELVERRPVVCCVEGRARERMIAS
jgi:hypothetical protein